MGLAAGGRRACSVAQVLRMCAHTSHCVGCMRVCWLWTCSVAQVIASQLRWCSRGLRHLAAALHPLTRWQLPLQERRTAGAYDYSGCMTCPRVMSLAGDRLHQEPVAELVALRTGESCREVDLELPEQQAVPLTQVRRQGRGCR